MDKNSELRGWKAHCVELQGKVDRLESEVARLKSAWHQDVLSRKDALIAELEAEKDVLKSALSVAGKTNSRLQSVIDAANAQEPEYLANLASEIHNMVLALPGGDYPQWDQIYDVLNTHKFYARPAPAQQSTAVAISKAENAARITEQDAQQIALSFYWFVENFKAQNGRNPSVVDWHDIVGRAQSIAVMAKLSGCDAAMIGGAPFLMSPLERKLKAFGVEVLYAFSERVSSEEVQSDGTVKKINVFKHVGFVQS